MIILGGYSIPDGDKFTSSSGAQFDGYQLFGSKSRNDFENSFEDISHSNKLDFKIDHSISLNGSKELIHEKLDSQIISYINRL